MNYSHEKHFKDLNVVVTGGSSGIGSAMAEALIYAQANVAIISRHSPDQWDNPVPTNWSKDNWISGDFNHPEILVKKTQQWVAEQWGGKIDVLIHSAVSYGYGSRHTFLHILPEELKEIMDVSVYSPFLLTRALLPFMLEQQKGLIIHISSEVAFNPGPGRIGYSVAKSAARTMFTGLAQELESSPVSVVGILPEGMVDTPGIRRRRPNDFDYSSYASANTFAPITLSLIETGSARYHGKFLGIDRAGNHRIIVGDNIVSQSK